MSLLTGWAARVTGVVAVVVTGVLVAAPAALASPVALAVADEAVRRRPRIGGFGLLGTLCCLAVVVVIVLAALAIARRRRPPRR